MANNSFTDIFIRRPVFATVLSLFVLLIGGISYFKLPIRQFPRIDPTVVTVTTQYPGASAKLMEGFVSQPLESAIASVDGIDYMTSNNVQGISTITVYFKLGYNINTATSDVSDKVSSVRWRLPTDIRDPVIAKQDPNANPTMYIAFTSDSLNAEAVTDYLLRVVQPQLETLDGVGEAKIFGDREYAMRIWLNPFSMAAHKVTATSIQSALLSNNRQSATGRVEASLNEFSVDTATDLNSAHQFDNLIIRDDNGSLVRIKDVGHAQLAAANARVSVEMGGKQAVVIGIIPKSTANPLSVAEEVNKQLITINKFMPKDLHAKVIWDTSKFISESIDEVQRTIIEATIFVILVIFLFLGSLRTLLVPLVTIPLSLIGAFGLMAAMDFSVNTLTLLAMVLAIGMVVDDAIVVSENIHRHLEMNKTPFQAAIDGASEIKFAVIAMTLTLAAVYAPIGFMEGLTGALFKEFAFSLAGAVIISGFVALTLSPMMCSKVLRSDAKSGALEHWINRFTAKMERGYHRLLSVILKLRLIILFIVAGIIVSCALLYMFTPKELAPKEDEGAILIVGNAPGDANLSFTEKYTAQLPPIYKSLPEYDTYGIINGIPTGVNSALSFLILKPWSERNRKVDAIIKDLFPKLWGIPGIQAFPVNPYSLPGATGFMPIQFVLKSTGSYERLAATMDKLMLELSKNSAIVNVSTNLKFDQPQIHVDIDRDKAGDMGILMKDIGTTLNIALGEPTVGYFSMGGRSYDVIPQLEKAYRNRSSKLNNLYLTTATNSLVPLSNIVNITYKTAPQSLNHFQQLRSATLTAAPVPGYPFGSALQYIINAAEKVMPEGVQYDFAGESRQYIDARGKMTQTFIFALIFIFLVLAAQFESFRDPFIVMMSVPLSTLGALLGVWLIGGTMNIYTEIGIVTLVGLISKHGILMVEFANQLQEQGRELREAIVEAASIRLRPILMTTAAMILGAVPLALASGAGAVARQQMGATIIGGMLIGTLFTLFVVPTFYTYLATRKEAIPQDAQQEHHT